jgi:hydrogenase maturation factor
MSSTPTLGKIDQSFFDRVIFPHLGAARPEVVVRPQMGVDNGIIDLGHDQVMAVTTDPISYIPELGPRDSAWISAHLVLSDLVTSGLKPAYGILNFNLPPELSSHDFEVYWKCFHRELAEYGIAVVAGHTGRYEGCGFTIIGSFTLLGTGHKNSFLTPSMAQPGDQLILTKGAMLATCGLLARVFPATIEEKFGSQLLNEAQEFFNNLPTIEDARLAISVGIHDQGVTAMHDATEGGILGAAFEFASVADCGLRIDIDGIPIRDEVKKICNLFDLDPYRSLSEGALLIAMRPDKSGDVINALSLAGIECTHIADFVPQGEGISLVQNGESQELKPMSVDPYWDAYGRAVSNGWK